LAVPWCANDEEPATFLCPECSKYWCPGCVKHGVGERHAELVCPECHVPVRWLERTTQRHPGKTFWYHLAKAFTRPLTGRELLVLSANALFIFLLLLAAPVLHRYFARTREVYGAIAGAVAYVFAWGHLVLVLFRTTRETGVGHEPGLRSLIGPTPARTYRDLAKFILMLWACTLPAVLVSRLANGVPRTLLGGIAMTAGGMYTLASLIMIKGPSTGVRVVALACAFFLPMALLTEASFGRIQGINPIPALVSIFRVPCQYVCGCIGFYAVPVTLTWVFWRVFKTAAAAWRAMGEISGWADVDAAALITVFFGVLLLVYGTFVGGRILGALRAANLKRLGWIS
jgi:hypothetical protein